MEDLQVQDRVIQGGRDDWEGESLVPDGAGGAAVVGLGGQLAIGVEPEDGVGLEFAVAPVDVLEMLGRHDRQIQIQLLLLLLLWNCCSCC